MKALVTGADGFVGRWLVRALLEAGHEVIAAVRQSAIGSTDWPEGRSPVREAALELEDSASVRECAELPCDAVVHLAAVASGRDALCDPWNAWAVNAGGTARLCQAVGARVRAGHADPLVLCVSSGEVYGQDPGRPLSELDLVAPRSPYAASKAGAELAARETAVRTGLRVIVARAFPHTGPGQDERFVAPAFARRLRGARRSGARVIKVGNLEPVRDLLDVRDVVAAYLALLARGRPGETYNVASGHGLRLGELLHRLAAILGVDVIPEADPELVRQADSPSLVGDASRLRVATGWTPAIPLDTTLRDLVNAQAD